MDAIETLARVKLFAELPEEDLQRLARLAVRRTAAKGDAIIKQGEWGVGFYAIESGRVAITAKHGDSEEQVAVIGPGGFFGEMALFENQLRSATVTALEPTALIVLTRWDFLAELKRPGRERGDGAAGDAHPPYPGAGRDGLAGLGWGER